MEEKSSRSANKKCTLKINILPPLSPFHFLVHHLFLPPRQILIGLKLSQEYTFEGYTSTLSSSRLYLPDKPILIRVNLLLLAQTGAPYFCSHNICGRFREFGKSGIFIAVWTLLRSHPTVLEPSELAFLSDTI